MIKIKPKVFLILIISIFISTLFPDVTSSIKSLVGRNAEGYLQPLGTMMGSGMNSGFYRKASPHKILGFDLTIDLVYAMAPPGKTTYNFVIPTDDSISFPFQFQFPKSLLTSDLDILNKIPTASTNDLGEELYKDQTITFGLAISDMLDAPEKPAQNILGTDESTTLTVTLDNAIPQIFDQVIDNTWNVAQNIPGLGIKYDVTEKNPVTGDDIVLATIQPLYSGRDEFKEKYGAPIDTLIRSGLGEMDMPTLPIPGGFANSFNTLPIDIGFPLPIAQASIGLPFHTEITARGLPFSMPLPIGQVKYGGFGGKIGISEYLTDILYEPEANIEIFSDTSFYSYILESNHTEIKPEYIDNVIYNMETYNLDINELDSLNYLYSMGDTTVFPIIKNYVKDVQIQLEGKPMAKKKKKKKKKFPIDLSIGYYNNDLELDFSGATINSTNSMLSLQAGKTLNLPSFLSFIGGIGIYGGIGFEKSDLQIGYELANPLAYGCFTSSNTYVENIAEEECTGTKDWKTGVPTDISLNFPGDNSFRSLIGARMRILFVDAYVDYNMGNNNKAINAGFGITFR